MIKFDNPEQLKRVYVFQVDFHYSDPILTVFRISRNHWGELSKESPSKIHCSVTDLQIKEGIHVKVGEDKTWYQYFYLTLEEANQALFDYVNDKESLFYKFGKYQAIKDEMNDVFERLDKAQELKALEPNVKQLNKLIDTYKAKHNALYQEFSVYQKLFTKQEEHNELNRQD